MNKTNTLTWITSKSNCTCHFHWYPPQDNTTGSDYLNMFGDLIFVMGTSIMKHAFILGRLLRQKQNFANGRCQFIFSRIWNKNLNSQKSSVVCSRHTIIRTNDCSDYRWSDHCKRTIIGEILIKSRFNFHKGKLIGTCLLKHVVLVPGVVSI